VGSEGYGWGGLLAPLQAETLPLLPQSPQSPRAARRALACARCYPRRAQVTWRLSPSGHAPQCSWSSRLLRARQGCWTMFRTFPTHFSSFGEAVSLPAKSACPRPLLQPRAHWFASPDRAPPGAIVSRRQCEAKSRQVFRRLESKVSGAIFPLKNAPACVSRGSRESEAPARPRTGPKPLTTIRERTSNNGCS